MLPSSRVVARLLGRLQALLAQLCVRDGARADAHAGWGLPRPLCLYRCSSQARPGRSCHHELPVGARSMDFRVLLLLRQLLFAAVET